MISVVIPYFQREPGILRRALASIASQRDCPLPIHVIVVDDASPVPASTELEGIDLGQTTRDVIRQPNAGPGGARNAGLDRLPAGTRYVAFLDSDDEWSDDHLARAATALASGHDLYFADHLQLGATNSAFVRAGRIVATRHPALAGPSGLHAFAGDLFDQTLLGNVIGTSTVVFDAARFGGQRFLPEFRSAGEDYLFWMSLAQAGARAAFSTRCEAVYGRGVNIFAGSGWGTEGHLQRIHDELRFKKTLSRLWRLSNAQRTQVRISLRDLRLAFAREVLHRAAHRRGLPLGLLSRHVVLDPLSLAMLVPNAVRVAAGRG